MFNHDASSPGIRLDRLADRGQVLGLDGDLFAHTPLPPSGRRGPRNPVVSVVLKPRNHEVLKWSRRMLLQYIKILMWKLGSRLDVSTVISADGLSSNEKE
jgi:hypothetical protein